MMRWAIYCANFKKGVDIQEFEGGVKICDTILRICKHYYNPIKDFKEKLPMVTKCTYNVENEHDKDEGMHQVPTKEKLWMGKIILKSCLQMIELYFEYPC